MREAAPGGSTAMPHKRNPVAAVAALGCALPAPGLVAALLAAMVQEHERAAGAWHAEWAPLSRPAGRRRVGRRVAAHLARAACEVDAERMRANAGDDRRRRLRGRARRPRAGGRRMIVHHVVTGPAEAPALVLSNSLGADLRMWDPQADALAERFRLVRYDTRGHGESPVPDGPYTIDDVGQDLIALLDHLEIERAHVRGLSLGGMTGHVAGHPRARAAGPARAAVHVGAARAARDVGRARRRSCAPRAPRPWPTPAWAAG